MGEFIRQLLEPIAVAFRPKVVHRDIASLDQPVFAQSLLETFDLTRVEHGSACSTKVGYVGEASLLGPREIRQ
ncbi:hypothetical protein [Bradyrhizobium jicamae]|uniref:hypothetical protein n=1 Tax=Bradyrhizobium jicamae TaxID=280332 RepID=UPI001BAC61CD|nr:hypothetical protein [Bradyrhizobium jicamae]MBR0939045.1 hypothetical protein [Bradyrhizobium jicamae]